MSRSISSHISSRLSRHPLGTLRPGTIIYSSGRLRGFQHMSLLGHPVLLQSCLTHSQAQTLLSQVLHSQASRQVLLPAQQPEPCCWPGHTQQKGDVELTVGDNSVVAAASMLALRLVRGRTWEISREKKLKCRRRESEVRKRSWERCMLQENCDAGWRKQPTRTNRQLSQNCIKGSRSSWRLPGKMAL